MKNADMNAIDALSYLLGIKPAIDKAIGGEADPTKLGGVRKRMNGRKKRDSGQTNHSHFPLRIFALRGMSQHAKAPSGVR